MYSSDHHFPGLAYAWPTTARIASGTVTHIDASAAEKLPGVLAIYTHENIGSLNRIPPAPLLSLMIDETRPPLEDTTIRYYGQYVAVAVAETMEQARAAAEAVKVTYATTKHNRDDKLLGSRISEQKPKEVTKRGTTAAGFEFCFHQARCGLQYACRDA
jgi:xanthine dehydrogenase YagR molybdenum-binding subunit